MSLRVIGLLAVCGLKYPEDLGDAVKGTPPYEKLTLGQLVEVIREAGRRQPEIAARHLPGRRPLSRFLDEVSTVNATWRHVKHDGEDVEEKILLARMRTMLKLAKLLSEEPSAGMTPNQPMEPTGFAGGS